MSLENQIKVLGYLQDYQGFLQGRSEEQIAEAVGLTAKECLSTLGALGFGGKGYVGFGVDQKKTLRYYLLPAGRACLEFLDFQLKWHA